MSAAVAHFDDQSKRIEVSKGHSFVINLPAMPTAGFQWMVARCPEHVHLEEDSFRPSSGAMGAAATQQLRFHADKQGSDPITLSYVRLASKL